MQAAGRFLNESEVNELLKKVLPRAIQYASGYTLTELVVRGHTRFFLAQSGSMIMRNRGFARKSTRFDRARASAKINQQIARFFTQTIDRGTGWAEQPVHGLDLRKRKWTKKARRGGQRGVVRSAYRLKPDREVPHLFDENTLADIYDYVYRNNYFNKPIVTFKNKYGIDPGVVRFTKKRIQLKRKTPKKDGTFSYRRGNLIMHLAYAKRSHASRVDIIGNVWNSVKNDVWDIWEVELMKQLSRKVSI